MSYIVRGAGQTSDFETLLSKLRDERAKGRIGLRLKRLGDSHFGDMRSLGGGLSELKVDYGPGYRVYLTRRGAALIVLLCGGDKSTQKRDIDAARWLLAELENDDAP